MVVLPVRSMRSLASAASSPAVAHLFVTASSSPSAARLLSTAASSPSAAGLLYTAGSSPYTAGLLYASSPFTAGSPAASESVLTSDASSPASTRLLYTAASSPYTTGLLYTSASSPHTAGSPAAYERALATDASSPAAMRLLYTSASSPATAREIGTMLLPSACQGMFRLSEDGFSAIKGPLLLGNLTAAQVARFLDNDLGRGISGDNEVMGTTFRKSVAAGWIPKEDPEKKIDDVKEDNKEDDDDDDDDGDEDGDNKSEDGGKRGHENCDPPPSENGGGKAAGSSGNGGQGRTCFETHILYELSEMRKEMRAIQWKQWKQSNRVQKEVEDFRRDINNKIADVRLVLTNAALKFLLGIFLLLLSLVKWAAPYVKEYVQEVWDQQLKDKIFGDLYGRREPVDKK